MSKTQRMSAEEKQATMLALMRFTKDVYNKDELEKAGAQQGVKMDTIMDFVKILVDEKAVQTDKIGSGNFYWSFPSDEFVRVKGSLLLAERQIAADEAAIVALEAKKKALEAASNDAAAVAAGLREIDQLKAECGELQKQLQGMADSDPAVYNKIVDTAKLAKEGADRWTENVFACRAWIIAKMPGRTPAEIDKMMGIPAGFDFIE